MSHPAKGTIKKGAGPHGEDMEADGHGGWHPVKGHAHKDPEHKHAEKEHH